MTTTAVLIYEDNELLRRSIELLLQTTPDLEVKGSFADCNKVQQQVADLKPALVIMDMDMPGINGTEGLALIKEMDAAIPVVMHLSLIHT